MLFNKKLRNMQNECVGIETKIVVALRSSDGTKRGTKVLPGPIEMCNLMYFGSTRVYSTHQCVHLLNVYLFLRERKRRGGGAGREGDRVSDAGSSLQEPRKGLNSQTARSRPEPESEA